MTEGVGSCFFVSHPGLVLHNRNEGTKPPQPSSPMNPSQPKATTRKGGKTNTLNRRNFIATALVASAGTAALPCSATTSGDSNGTQVVPGSKGKLLPQIESARERLWMPE